MTILNFQLPGGVFSPGTGPGKAPGGPGPTPQPAKPEEKKQPPRPLTRAETDAMFRSQQLWDATMAGSILRAAAQPGVP